MTTEKLIRVKPLFSYHNVEISFISQLLQSDIIAITTVEEDMFIEEDEIQALEKIFRLNHDLDINLEGIEAINLLLQRINEMQDEISLLKNKVRFYETE